MRTYQHLIDRPARNTAEQQSITRLQCLFQLEPIVLKIITKLEIQSKKSRFELKSSLCFAPASDPGPEHVEHVLIDVR